MASTGQNDDQVKVSDGGGLDGKKQVDDNSESSNLSFYEIRRRKIQWLAVLKAKWKEADKQKKSMLASGELPTPNQTMSKIALPTTVTGKRKAPESCDMLKSVKLPKGKEELHGTMAAFFSEKWPATESHASYEEIMGKSRREIIYSVGGKNLRLDNWECDLALLQLPAIPEVKQFLSSTEGFIPVEASSSSSIIGTEILRVRVELLGQQHQRAAEGQIAEVVIGLVAQQGLGQMGENGSQGPIAIHHPAGKGIPSAAIKIKTLDRPYCLRIGNHSAIFSKSRKLDSKIKSII
ncbi:hypothetical protein LINPERHAP2_LOCUS10087 [Linum perenne]